jgi:hypothetical protein
MRRLARRFDTIGTCSPNCLIERFQVSNHEHALSFQGETGRPKSGMVESLQIQAQGRSHDRLPSIALWVANLLTTHRIVS